MRMVISHSFIAVLLQSHAKFLFVAVIGALIGKQKGRNIEIMNSFELNFTVGGAAVGEDEAKSNAPVGDIIIDREYYNTKEEQCKEIFLLLMQIFFKYFLLTFISPCS